MALMRDHFEGTEFDLTRGVGAGPYALPYRWRPLTWKVDGKEYLNERAIATQQTGFVFVSSRAPGCPGPSAGCSGSGSTTPPAPSTCPSTPACARSPRSLAEGTGDPAALLLGLGVLAVQLGRQPDLRRYSDMIVDVRRAQQELEGGFLERQAEVEKAARAPVGQLPEAAAGTT